MADPKTFRSGRDFSAWIGLVTKHNSSRGKEARRRQYPQSAWAPGSGHTAAPSAIGTTVSFSPRTTSTGAVARGQIRRIGLCTASRIRARVYVFSITEITDWTQGGRHASKLGEECRRVGVGRCGFRNHRRDGDGSAEGNEALCVQLRRAEPRQVDHSKRLQRQGPDTGRLLFDPSPQGRRAVRLRQQRQDHYRSRLLGTVREGARPGPLA